jgi:ubiquinone/menaquinone biosynthesis C-methylase UbiE
MSPNWIVFDQVFWENVWRTESQIEIITQLYDLPLIKQEMTVSKDFMHHILKKKSFVILVLYDGHWRILLCQWEEWFHLLWTSIRKEESIHGCISRLAASVHIDIEISDVLPVCHVINRFIDSSEQESYTDHVWVVYMARIRNSTKLWTIFNDSILVNINQIDINWINKYSNKEVIKYVFNHFSLLLTNEKYDTQDEEIDTNKSYSSRYGIHNLLAKPLLKLFDKSKVQMKQRILEYLWKYNKILDLSCWDDSLLLDTKLKYDNISIAVGNDISRSQIELLSEKYNKVDHGVFFTNHNASDMPFNPNYFDIVLCKNTLHHMPSRESLISLLDSSYNCSKEILFIEIENPNITWWLPRLMHRYWYRKFLWDVWWAYLWEHEFKQIIENHFSHRAEVYFDKYKTLQWNYLFAHIKKVSHL